MLGRIAHAYRIVASLVGDIQGQHIGTRPRRNVERDGHLYGTKVNRHTTKKRVIYQLARWKLDMINDSIGRLNIERQLLTIQIVAVCCD
ncbi:hypothetical protein CF98_02635 [Halopseudomonas bauzanensis]|nr:hypothetical protein CF98_02635 [Halopseudomonas bauzanensis]